MKILNMTSSQLNWSKNQFRFHKIFSTIIQSLQSKYPQWYKFLESTRQEFKKELGIHNHETISQIEKSIMNKLKNELYKKGYNNLIRVHDALYGTDEINKDTIDGILYNIVSEYIEDISCNNNNSNKVVTEFISNMSPPPQYKKETAA